MGKSLSDRVEDFISSLPDQVFRIDSDNRDELHVQLTAAMGEDVEPGKILEAYLALLKTNKLKPLFDNDRHVNGLEATNLARPASVEMKFREGDPTYVTLTKCIAALRQEDGKNRNTFEVLNELVGGTAEHIRSAMATLRKISFYKAAGYQNRKYEITSELTSLTATELVELLNKKRTVSLPQTPAFQEPASVEEAVVTNTQRAENEPRERPKSERRTAGTEIASSLNETIGSKKEASAEKTAAKVPQTAKELIEGLTDQLEQAVTHQAALQEQVEALQEKLTEEQQNFEKMIGDLQTELEAARKEVENLQSQEAVPSELRQRAMQILGAATSKTKQ